MELNPLSTTYEAVVLSILVHHRWTMYFNTRRNSWIRTRICLSMFDCSTSFFKLYSCCGPDGSRTRVHSKWLHHKLYCHSLLKSALSLGTFSITCQPPPPCLTNRETSVTIMFLGQSPTSCRAITQQHVQKFYYCLLFFRNVGRYHPDSCD